MKPWRIAPGLTFTRGLLQIFQAEDIMEGLNFMNLNLEMVLRHWLYHIHQYHHKNNAKFSKNDNKKSTATIRVFTAEDNTEMITMIAAIVMIMSDYSGSNDGNSDAITLPIQSLGISHKGKQCFNTLFGRVYVRWGMAIVVNMMMTTTAKINMMTMMITTTIILITSSFFGEYGSEYPSKGKVNWLCHMTS